MLLGAQRKLLSHGILSLIAAGLTLNAPNFSQESLGVTYLEWLTNSMLVAIIVVSVVLWWARKATKTMQLVPGATQNSFEAVVEFLYDMLEGIVGKHMVGRVFQSAGYPLYLHSRRQLVRAPSGRGFDRMGARGAGPRL